MIKGKDVLWWSLLTTTDLYVKEMEVACPSLIAEGMKKDAFDEDHASHV
jgi:hypothetical protein